MNRKCNFIHVEKLRIIVSCFVKSATDTFKSLEQNQRSYQLHRRSGIALMKYSKGIKLHKKDPYAFAPPPQTPPIGFSGNAGCVKDTSMPMAYKRYMFVNGVTA